MHQIMEYHTESTCKTRQKGCRTLGRNDTVSGHSTSYKFLERIGLYASDKNSKNERHKYIVSWPNSDAPYRTNSVLYVLQMPRVSYNRNLSVYHLYYSLIVEIFSVKHPRQLLFSWILIGFGSEGEQNLSSDFEVFPHQSVTTFSRDLTWIYDICYQLLTCMAHYQYLYCWP